MKHAVSVLWLLLMATALGCATNINDLLKETYEGDAESVQRATSGIGEILREKEETGLPYTAADEAGLAFLKEVAESGSSDLNRARAIATLGRLERPVLTDVYAARLSDPFWTARLEAARALSRRPVPTVAPQLATQLAVESRSEVRLEIIRALARAGGPDALRALLKVVIAPDFGEFGGMKLVAYDAVKDLSERDFDLEDTTLWKEYYDQRFGKTGASAGGSSPGEKNRQGLPPSREASAAVNVPRSTP